MIDYDWFDGWDGVRVVSPRGYVLALCIIVCCRAAIGRHVGGELTGNSYGIGRLLSPVAALMGQVSLVVMRNL